MYLGRFWRKAGRYAPRELLPALEVREELLTMSLHFFFCHADFGAKLGAFLDVRLHISAAVGKFAVFITIDAILGARATVFVSAELVVRFKWHAAALTKFLFHGLPPVGFYRVSFIIA